MMKYLLTCIALGVAFLTLSSCANRFLPVKCAENMAMCKKECHVRFHSCKKTCSNNCKECSSAANCSAARNYSQYKHEQYVQGGAITRELKSYRDQLQCRKTTCNCLADYNVCTQSCTGKVHKRLQVGPACC